MNLGADFTGGDQQAYILRRGGSDSRPPYACTLCDRTFGSPQALGSHVGWHRKPIVDRRNHGDSRGPYVGNYTCKYCAYAATSNVRLGGHVTHCVSNPNYDRIRAAQANGQRSHPQTDETRRKISIARSAFIEEQGGGGFSAVRWYRVKNLHGDEYVVRGKLEVACAEWLNTSARLWVRRVYLDYVGFDGRIKRYAPDFYLPDDDLYIEMKGYFSVLDRQKINLVCEYNDVCLIVMFTVPRT